MSFNDWDLFRAFLALGSTQSSDVAAGQLGISVVTLKRRLARLEDVLKSKLYQGYGSRFELTDEGESLMKVLSRADSILAEIEPDLRFPHPAARTPASIWMMDALFEHFFVSFLENSSDLLREFSLQMRSGPMPELSQSHEHNITLSHYSSESPRVSSIAVGVHQVAFGCSLDYVERYGLPTLQNLDNHHLAIVEDYRVIRALWDGLSDIVERCRSHIEVDSTASGHVLAKNGHYFTMVTQWSLPSGYVVCPDLPVLTLPSFVSVSKAFFDTEKGRLLTENIVEHARSFFAPYAEWPPVDQASLSLETIGD